MKRIDLRGAAFDCLPRILWQALFDEYRQNGGSLDNMDNMLIDLRNCEKAFLEHDGELSFLFGFDIGGSTTWVYDKTFTRENYLRWVASSFYDNFLFVRVFDGTIEIETLYVEEIRKAVYQGTGYGS